MLEGSVKGGGSSSGGGWWLLGCNLGFSSSTQQSATQSSSSLSWLLVGSSEEGKHIHEMLRGNEQQQEEEEHHSEFSSAGSSSSRSSLRQLLIECARAVAAREWERAIHCLVRLSQRSSPQGESCERLASYFATALARCVASRGRNDAAIRVLMSQHMPPQQSLVTSSAAGGDNGGGGGEELHAAYLALNQVTPFIRFAHLSANQAILEAVEGEAAVHIVDLGIMQGLQWPPLMQALAERRRQQQQVEEEEQGAQPLLRLRITGTGPSMGVLEQTGSRLRDFARTLDLPFEFDAICLRRSFQEEIGLLSPERLRLREGEALVVNCMMQLHRLLLKKREKRLATTMTVVALERIKALSPKVVAIAEKEADHQQEGFLDRFMAALEHYAALFDSLEATLPPKNSQRLMIERVLLGKEIGGILACQDDDDDPSSSSDRYESERHQSFSKWKEAMEAAGFQLVPPSAFAIAQARLLLRLHYPADGYRLLIPPDDHPHDGCLFLSWQNKPLFAVSAWH